MSSISNVSDDGRSVEVLSKKMDEYKVKNMSHSTVLL